MEMRSMRKSARRPIRLDLSSPATAEAFEAAAEAYTADAIKTQASAIKALHREGILTKTGRLAKPYADKA
jgi:hypothetical protein